MNIHLLLYSSVLFMIVLLITIAGLSGKPIGALILSGIFILLGAIPVIFSTEIVELYFRWSQKQDSNSPGEPDNTSHNEFKNTFASIMYVAFLNFLPRSVHIWSLRIVGTCITVFALYTLIITAIEIW